MDTVSRRKLTLRAFIALLVLGVSFVSFHIGSIITTVLYRNALEQRAVDVAETVAGQVSVVLSEMMREGVKKQTISTLLSRLQGVISGDGTAEIAIYRVGERTGSAEVDLALGKGREMHFMNDNILTSLEPIVATEDCLRCHTAVRRGGILGIVVLKQDMQPGINKIHKDYLMFFLLMSPIPLAIAFFLSRYFSRSVSSSVRQFSESVRHVSSLDDLAKLEMQTVDLRFRELHDIFSDIAGLVDRVRSVAADRDLLEFESRLIEKLMITTTVVEHWKTHVNRLLVEINEYVTAYALFSLFRVDNTLYSVHVFWQQLPQEHCRKKMEEIVREEIRKQKFSVSDDELVFVHNAADMDISEGCMKDLRFDVVTRSMSMEQPRINGMVGICVPEGYGATGVRAVVLDSILAAVLNVVGSVKAIGKYTSDLEYYATRDALTGLYNQRMYRDILSHEIGQADRFGSPFTILMADIDNFKVVNDTMGNQFGDRFLMALAAELRESLREGDVIARYGGDVFAVLLPEASAEEAVAVARRMREQAERFVLYSPDNAPVRVTVSVGAATYPQNGKSAGELITVAETMLSKVKKEGKNGFAFPDGGSYIADGSRIGRISIAIMRALEMKTVIPYFQPIMDMQTGAVFTHELLMRIPMGGEILPAGQFIEIAEDMGVVHLLDYQCIEQALNVAVSGGYTGTLFINLSPRALIVQGFIEALTGIVAKSGFPAERIVLELTERETVKNLDQLARFVAGLKSHGFQFAIDDFGSGYSSYQYMKLFPIDVMKIEGEFIRHLKSDTADLAFVKSMVTLAQELKIRTVAEYIEDAEIAAVVRSLGIDMGQGYGIGKPSPVLLPAGTVVNV